MSGAPERRAGGSLSLPIYAGDFYSPHTLGWDKAMAKIRHLAIKTKSPERLAAFYEEVFGMQRIHSGGGAIYMSDGYLTLALLRNRGEAAPSGINHFGFHVEDLKDVEEKLKKFDEPLEQRPANRPFAEYRAMDPDGNLFDVSVHGYNEAEFRPEREKRAREPSKDKVPS
jgi:catechol 2,3-dioxygenase-like lactoylglutathione lyase family enzyme